MFRVRTVLRRVPSAVLQMVGPLTVVRKGSAGPCQIHCAGRNLETHLAMSDNEDSEQRKSTRARKRTQGQAWSPGKVSACPPVPERQMCWARGSLSATRDSRTLGTPGSIVYPAACLLCECNAFPLTC